MTLKELYEMWEKDAPLSLSMRTVEAYKRRLKELVKELGEKEVEELTEADIAFFVRRFRSESVRKQIIAAIGNLKKYAKAFGMQIPEVPEFLRPKNKENIPKPVEESVFWKMMKIAEEQEKEGLGWRKAVLILMGLAGLRLQEALSVSPFDLTKEGDVVWITVRKGKGKKERRVPLTGEYAEWLWENRHSYLPIGVRYHRRTIQDTIRRLGKKAGDPEVSPHRLRHFYATMLTKKGIPVQVIQKLVGHSSPKTTMIYAKVADGLLVDAVRKITAES
jgi:site-specific recombinase XerD